MEVMRDLFDKEFERRLKKEAPLAERVRPRDFEGFYGQEELVGEGSPLRQAIQSDNLTSLIFWGPPGSGKTTLARIIAEKTDAHLARYSAVDAGVKDIRQAVEEARNRRKFKEKKTILFIDEIHRFNKAQQDRLLPHVEKGIVILIGATTENPSFEVIAPLLSRSSVYSLDPLSGKAMRKILLRALKEKEMGLGNEEVKITEEGLSRLVNFANGDARVGLNALEFVAESLGEKGVIKAEKVSATLEDQALRYDKKGERHYNTASAFIKSMRRSDPDAALYWLARMLESGEDPRFVARRMIIFASEDVGNADPRALEVAVSCARAVEQVGLPEAEINLAQGVAYLAVAPKNRAAYNAIKKARKDAREGSFGVPLHLRNPTTDLMEKMGYGKEKEDKESNFPPQIGERNYYRRRNGEGE